MEKEEEPLNYDLALQQHNDMVKSLQSLGVEVTVLETDESTPDCVFVEDPAVVIGDTVLITNPGAESRKPETIPLKKHFQENVKHLKIVEMKAPAELDARWWRRHVHRTRDLCWFIETNEFGRCRDLEKCFP